MFESIFLILWFIWLATILTIWEDYKKNYDYLQMLFDWFDSEICWFKDDRKKNYLLRQIADKKSRLLTTCYSKHKLKRWWKYFFQFFFFFIKFWFCWHFVIGRPVIIIRSRRVLAYAVARFSAEPWPLLISGHSGDQFDKCWWALNYSRQTIMFSLAVSWVKFQE